MKNHFLLKFLTLSTVMGTLLFSCTREEPLMDWKYIHNQEEIVAKSKMFFEDLIIQGDSDGILDTKSSLAPGEITPVWENAVHSMSNGYNYVYVPFEADYYYNVREKVTQKSGEVVTERSPYNKSS